MIFTGQPAIFKSRMKLGAGILIIDDEQSTACVFQRYLNRKGFKTDTAAGGAEGLEKFKAGHYDLVIIDMHMPGLSTADVVAELKSLDRGLNILAVSASAESREINEVLAAGAKKFIDKFILLPDLLAEIKRI